MPSLFSIKQYFIHLIKAKDEHSIHSPFMFELYCSVIKKNKGNNSELIENLQKKFNPENIIIIDSCYEAYKEVIPSISDSTVLIVKKPYDNEKSLDEFKKITNDIKIMVCADLFKLGLIFYSSKLKKQYYTLKF